MNSSSSSSLIIIISDCFVKPLQLVPESEKPIYLPPCDLISLSIHYIQKGLLFVKPQEAYEHPTEFTASLLKKLKFSLSLALVHFYPLAGQLRTLKRDDPHLYTVYVDCSSSSSQGCRFIYGTIDATISDSVSPVHVPVVVQSFFDHDRAINHDGHFLPLFSVQVTELVDGVFIGCSMNHCIGDGSSFWHLLNSWSEIHRQIEGGNYSGAISRPPVHRRWFPDGCESPVKLPFNDPSEFAVRYEAFALLVETVFHFSSESLAKLKAKANQESKTDRISSFQALSALVWRSITRARGFSGDHVTSCWIVADNRSRMNPQLSQDYFGNFFSPVRASTTTAGELLGQGLGWVAMQLHQGIAEHTNDKVSQWHKEWLNSPRIPNLGRIFNPDNIMIASSPRFNIYGVEFGLGKAVAVRSGYANKYDGKIASYPGKEGGGSVDLEVCLLADRMAMLGLDEEFMAAVTL